MQGSKTNTHTRNIDGMFWFVVWLMFYIGYLIECYLSSTWRYLKTQTSGDATQVVLGWNFSVNFCRFCDWLLDIPVPFVFLIFFFKKKKILNQFFQYT